MPRIARAVIPECPHHVTQRGSNRIDIYLDRRDREFFIECLRKWSGQTETQVLAYCLMTNHFHLLLSPATADGLGRCLHGVTFRYAQYFNWRHGRCGRLWQNRYFSCPIDRGSQLWTVARYIERNPLRAGFVRRVEDWPWSSAGAHIRGTRDPALSEPSWLTRDEVEQYRHYLTETGTEDEVRMATKTGRPLGPACFIRRLEAHLERTLAARPVGRPRETDTQGNK